MKLISLLSVILIMSGISYSQIDSSLILGLTNKNSTASVFDLSDPNGVNMEVNLWGYIRYPGRYIVPVNTTFIDLISFSGGPTDESNLEEIRIIRKTGSGEKPSLIKLNYDDILWSDKLSTSQKMNPVLLPGDVIVVMKEKRYTFRDDLSIYLPILTTLVSITTFIITLARN
ncbi:MAG: SLBB domain-containing protein [Ignavibacteria bacterium]|nr:SLBB domain-containing protein [Ignavibacteria bacterium]